MTDSKSNEKDSIRSYNDYCVLAQSYLSEYHTFQCVHKNMEAEKADLEKRLKKCEDVSASVSKYGLSATVPSSGAVGSVVERTLERRERIRMRLRAVEEDIDKLELIIGKIDRSLLLLSAIEREMVKLHYVEGLGWEQTSSSLQITRTWATEKGNEALKKMALMMFGSVASMPEHRQFCFVE